MAERRGWPYEPVEVTEPVAPPPAPPPPVPEPIELPVEFPVDPVELEGPVEDVHPARANRAAIVVAAIAGAVALVLTVAGVTDWWVRNRELDTLLDGVERSERAQYPYKDVVTTTQSTCIRRFTCDVTPVVQAARVALVELERAAEQVADTDLARFHGSIRKFRTVYLEHNRAWRDHLDQVVVRPTYFNMPDDAIETTWQEVNEVARQAVPPLPLNGVRDRINRMLNA